MWRSHATWFVVLAVVCMAGPYVLGVPPTTHRHRVLLAVTLVFLAWLLGMMAPLRS